MDDDELGTNRARIWIHWGRRRLDEEQERMRVREDSWASVTVYTILEPRRPRLAPIFFAGVFSMIILRALNIMSMLHERKHHNLIFFSRYFNHWSSTSFALLTNSIQMLQKCCSSGP